MAETKTWMEVIEESYQFYTYLFTIFVVCMGATRWYGKQIWRDREAMRRAASNQPTASLFSIGGNSEQSFTYASLFRGGLAGLYSALVLLMYVVFMLIFAFGMAAYFEVPNFKTLAILPLVSILMFYPILMAAFVVGLRFFMLRKHNTFRHCGPVLAIVVISLLASAVAAEFVTDKGIVVAVQFASTAALALCMSFADGMNDGISAVDPDKSFPLVSLEIAHGGRLEPVWLYERTDSDYRVLTMEGENHIIPATSVRTISKTRLPPVTEPVKSTHP